MKKAATGSNEIRRATPGWRFVTWMVLLAFTLQSFVTETHIHPVPQTPAGAAILKVLENASPPPAGNDQTKCPFCQAIVHAGAFFAPAAPLLLLPAVWTESAIPHLIAVQARPPSAHSWQSRAPPLA